MAIDASKTALTYCYNAAPAIKCVHTRYAVIKYRLIDDDEGKRERVDRIWDKRKMRKKKKNGEEKWKDGVLGGACAKSICEKGRKGKSEEWEYCERWGSIAISAKSIDRFGSEYRKVVGQPSIGVTLISNRLRDQKRSGAAIHHWQISKLFIRDEASVNYMYLRVSKLCVSTFFTNSIW